MKIFWSFILLTLISCGQEGGDTSLPVAGSEPIQDPMPQNIKQEFDCRFEENLSANLKTRNDGQLSLKLDHRRYQGRYKIKGRAVSLNIPQIGLSESSQSLSVRDFVLLKFKSQTLDCQAASHNRGIKSHQSWRCPKIKNRSRSEYEKNFFYFFPSGRVKRVINTYSKEGVESDERNGIYFKTGDKIWMSFPFYFKESFLTAENINGRLRIKQLEPSRGSCRSFRN